VRGVGHDAHDGALIDRDLWTEARGDLLTD
jgi:hypothetical protein